MAPTDVTGPNAAYVAQLLEDYLDAPASVPDEWRRVFEASADGVAQDSTSADGNGPPRAPAEPSTAARARDDGGAAAAAPAPFDGRVDETLLAGVAAAMA